MSTSKKQHRLDFIGFTGIDVIKGNDIIFALDEESSQFYVSAVGAKDLTKPYFTDRIIIRKEIGAKLMALIV